MDWGTMSNVTACLRTALEEVWTRYFEVCLSGTRPTLLISFTCPPQAKIKRIQIRRSVGPCVRFSSTDPSVGKDVQMLVNGNTKEVYSSIMHQGHVSSYCHRDIITWYWNGIIQKLTDNGEAQWGVSVEPTNGSIRSSPTIIIARTLMRRYSWWRDSTELSSDHRWVSWCCRNQQQYSFCGWKPPGDSENRTYRKMFGRTKNE